MVSTRPVAIILQLGPHDFAVAVWVRDEGGVGIYEIRQREIREASVEATEARPPESCSARSRVIVIRKASVTIFG